MLPVGPSGAPYIGAGEVGERALRVLSDIRALVRDDLEGAAAELALLRNTRYVDRTLLTDGALWARFDAEHGGVGAIEATLRDDHLGGRSWSALDSSARRFLAMAERTYREHRRDPAADLSPVLVGYAKAIEAQVNILLRRAMHTAREGARCVTVDDRTVRLPDALPLSLGQLSRALGGERELGDHLRKVLHDGAWLTNEFAAIIDAFAVARNPSAHGGELVPRETVTEWRNRLLGVGIDSVMSRLVLVR